MKWEVVQVEKIDQYTVRCMHERDCMRSQACMLNSDIPNLSSSIYVCARAYRRAREAKSEVI
jgi:hypothetical protein